ncbi:Hint domain-containing protein [Halocynthiibacter sp. C4]|uniref:Hint domain-containing protein n=1 Tax=Halocynthiibacter sp. C4 TaxID=2992758 RepID=UPI00237AB7DB|nr:Hint domain-containing protein [Halocynthiibacter sp. C4]MDE0588312.1 Hint domain-containing protein [Halocynthiibacter sp. C4]
MAEVVSYNPTLGIITIAAAPGEDVSGWSFESYEKSGSHATFLGSGSVDFSDPQVSASDPSVVYYTSNFGLTTGNSRDAVALIDGNGDLVEVIGWGNDSSYTLIGGTANGQIISGSSGNYAGDNDQNWYSKTPGTNWNGNNGSPDNGLPDDLQPYTPPCFASGTLIATPSGRCPVETLRVGDTVLTSSGEPKTIRWIGARTIYFSGDYSPNHLRPIIIRKDAYGEGRPDQDLCVSPQHRIVLSSEWNDLHFGCTDVLVAAKHLVNETTILRDENCTSIKYVHLLLDQHELLISNGLASESFYPGPVTLASLGAAQRSELMEIFPELHSIEPSYEKACLPSLDRWEACIAVSGQKVARLNQRA